MTAWLDPDATVTRVVLDPTSWVDVVPGLVPGAAAVHERVLSATPWRQGRVFRYERAIDEPRLGHWHQGAAPDPALAEVQRWISRRYRVSFDGTALALYRDGRDGVAWHRDREMRWLDDTVIAVLTLGATRPWRLKPVGDRRHPDPAAEDRGACELAPAGGDLLVMGGRCQADWLHTVPQVRRATLGGRVSAQWRWTSRRGARDEQPGYFAPRRFTGPSHVTATVSGMGHGRGTRG